MDKEVMKIISDCMLEDMTEKEKTEWLYDICKDWIEYCLAVSELNKNEDLHLGKNARDTEDFKDGVIKSLWDKLTDARNKLGDRQNASADALELKRAQEFIKQLRADIEEQRTENDYLRAELEQKEAEISALKKNAPAVAEIGYTLPNGYTTEFLDWIFDTLKVFDPTGRPKKQLEAALDNTRKNNSAYSEKISARIIPYAAQIARKAEARKGGAIKWK